MRLASVNTPQLLLPAPSTPPAAEKAGPSGDVTFSYNPQDQLVMSAGTYTVSGLNSDLSTDRLQSKDKVKAEGDSYQVANTDKRFPGINAFAAVDRTLRTFEAAYGEKINWAFEDKSAKLGVTGDAGKDLNAYYSRDDQGLFFFHYPVPQQSVMIDPAQLRGSGLDDADEAILTTYKNVFSGASGEVVGHECGHAMLDGLRPGYFESFNPDPGAFHESFGDVIALFTGLKNEAVLDKVVEQTGGDMSKPNCAAELGEELGVAINKVVGQDVTGGNFTRNAINNFKWQDPATLPQDGPPDQLTPEVHNFSRLWTGAIYDIFSAQVKDNMAAGQDAKTAISNAADEGLAMYGRLMRTAPEGDFTYKDMANALLKSDQDMNEGKHGEIIRSVMTNREILPKEEALFKSEPRVLPMGTREFATQLSGDQFGSFSGAQVKTLLSGANDGIFKDAEAGNRLQGTMERLIKAGEIKMTEPNQVVTTADMFKPNGEPYTGIVRWTDGQMTIERVKVAH